MCLGGSRCFPLTTVHAAVRRFQKANPDIQSLILGSDIQVKRLQLTPRVHIDEHGEIHASTADESRDPAL
jgi:hypothetical protein